MKKKLSRAFDIYKNIGVGCFATAFGVIGFFLSGPWTAAIAMATGGVISQLWGKSLWQLLTK